MRCCEPGYMQEFFQSQLWWSYMQIVWNRQIIEGRIHTAFANGGIVVRVPSIELKEKRSNEK